MASVYFQGPAFTARGACDLVVAPNLHQNKYGRRMSCRSSVLPLCQIGWRNSRSNVCLVRSASEESFQLEKEKPQEDDPLFKAQVEAFLDTIKWDDKGLAVAIAQHIDTGAILMQGFANKDAVMRTLTSWKATFYSRSRSSLWTKGETSFNFINVSDVFLDCDRDSIIYLGKPDGPTCHTGVETCYFTAVSDFVKNPQVEVKRQPLTSLYSLEATIFQRKSELVGALDGKPSWTKRLLEDQRLLCSKIREEANELCQTLEDDEDKLRTASEMADVLYHAMVLLAVKNVKMEEVLEILRARFNQSGIEEKKGRKSKYQSSRS